MIRAPRRHHQAMHALAELRVALLFRQEIAACAAVARLPGRAAVLRVKNAGRGDRNPHALFVGRIGHDGMEDQSARARLPLRARWVIAQPAHMRPGLTVILADEQARGLDARVEPAMRRREAPSGAHRLLAFGIGQTVAGMRPCLALVGRFPDCRAEPLIPTRGVDRAGCFIRLHMVDRPGVAERSAQRPGPAVPIALQQERSLLGSEQDQYAHGRSPG